MTCCPIHHWDKSAILILLKPCLHASLIWRRVKSEPDLKPHKAQAEGAALDVGSMCPKFKYRPRGQFTTLDCSNKIILFYTWFDCPEVEADLPCVSVLHILCARVYELTSFHFPDLFFCKLSGLYYILAFNYYNFQNNYYSHENIDWCIVNKTREEDRGLLEHFRQTYSFCR